MHPTEHQSRVVGVLGGMGPLATAAFYAELIRSTPATRDQDHLHVIIDSYPHVPDRTAFLKGLGPDPRPALVAGVRRLLGAGCDLVVIPCNTANVFRLDIEAATDIEVVDWIGIAVTAARATGAGRVGLLATTGMVDSMVYQERLADVGVQCIVPDSVYQASVMEAVYGGRGVKAAGPGLNASELLIGAAHHLIANGAESILLACTEIPVAIAPADSRWPVPAVDPANAVATAVVRLALMGGIEGART